jgi:uncharacterized metal-binding protein
MPSGRTHDRITLWALPVIAGLTLLWSQSSQTTLIVIGGFLFGGLMLSPDLDIQSRPYQRWGALRWIWLPYRRLGHRSWLSHGPLVGTALRLIYLGAILGLAGLVVLALWSRFVQLPGQAADQWQRTFDQLLAQILRQGWGWVSQHPGDAIALYIGLETGAMSHSLSDWIGSRRRKSRKS